MDTVAAGTEQYQLTTCSSHTASTADIQCGGTGNEVCGTILFEGTTFADSASQCVYKDTCRTLGKLNGSAFQVICHNDNPPDPVPAPADLLENVEILITTGGMGAWAGVQNMKVPSIDNYQTGWWIRDDNTSAVGIYTETDKPVHNLCETNNDCDLDMCCANWPDNNNKRCIDVAQAGTETTIQPFLPFTPTCAVDAGAPISASVDLAAEAQAKAAQAFTDFNALVEATLKENVGHADMTDEEKLEWDEAHAAKMVEEEAAIADDKLKANYSSMSSAAKAVWDAELLEWKKAVFETCEQDLKGIECKKNRDLRVAEEAARVAAGYYDMVPNERDIFDAAQKEEKKKLKATLTAAWVKDNTPAAGQAGSSCASANPCAGENHCCGTATPKGASGSFSFPNVSGNVDGKLENVCADKTVLAFTNEIGIEYSHVCGASKLIATAGALLATVFLM
jgi:hypothetical protein